MVNGLFSTTHDVLHKTLDLRHQRHAVLASNIANVETPGFLAKDVSFEEALRQAADPAPPQPSFLWQTHPRHLPLPGPPGPPAVRDVQGSLVAAPSDDIGRDLNTVSIDHEMGKLAKNSSHYNASADLLSRLYEQMKRTISEGGQ
ncbi:MAG: flagellar basal body rod protein FlgB [Candidatus Tectimicrobiota bacterium]